MADSGPIPPNFVKIRPSKVGQSRTTWAQLVPSLVNTLIELEQNCLGGCHQTGRPAARACGLATSARSPQAPTDRLCEQGCEPPISWRAATARHANASPHRADPPLSHAEAGQAAVEAGVGRTPRARLWHPGMQRASPVAMALLASSTPTTPLCHSSARCVPASFCGHSASPRASWMSHARCFFDYLRRPRCGCPGTRGQM